MNCQWINDSYDMKELIAVKYDGNRYQPITDDMYTKTISGYIEK